MADIFISYSQSDRERIRPIAEALTECGYSVFWDPEIEPGARFRSVVDAELDACSCVIVAWTYASVQSDWVIDEAEEGRRRGILVPVLLDQVEPPRGFRQIHFLDLTSFRAGNGRKAFQALLEAVEQMLGPPGSSAERQEAEPRQPRKPASISLGQLRIRLWLRSLALAVPLGAAAVLILQWSYGGSLLQRWLSQTGLSFSLLAGTAGVLVLVLGFWMRYAVFLQDRLLGLSSLRVLSRSFLLLSLAGVLTAAPTEPLWLLHRALFYGVVNSAVFSPDGTHLVTTARDGAVQLWNLRNTSSPEQLEGHTSSVLGAQYSNDGGRILTWSEDETARVWNAKTGKERAVLKGHRGTVLGALYSPDGGRILTWSRDRTARLWEAETGKERAVLEGHSGAVLGALYSPDGSRILTWSSDETARVWNAKTGEERAVLEGHAGAVLGALYSPDGGRILTWSTDKTARLWEASDGRQLKVLEGHKDDVLGGLYSSPDGNRILTWSADGTARLWDAATGDPLAVLTGHTGPVLGALYSPDGNRILTWSRDNSARLWDAKNGQPLFAPLGGHIASVRGAVYSPDHRHILTWSRDNTARLWDAETGQFENVLTGHQDWVLGAQYSNDGSRILTWSRDNTTRLWDADTGKELRTMGHVPKRAITELQPLRMPFVLTYADAPVPTHEQAVSDDSADNGTPQIVKTFDTSAMAFLRGLLLTGVLASVALVVWHIFRRRIAVSLFSLTIAYVVLSYLTHLPAEALLVWVLTAVAISPFLATAAMICALTLKYTLPAGFRPAAAEAYRMRT